jgi:hypothetical protein
MSDFTIDDHGSLILLTPRSAGAIEWITDNLGPELPWFAGAVPLEPKYLQSILHDIGQDDLTWCTASPTRH